MHRVEPNTGIALDGRPERASEGSAPAESELTRPMTNKETRPYQGTESRGIAREIVTDGGTVETLPDPAAIRERPSAGTMAITPLQREAREISRQRAFDGPHDIDLADALFARERHLQQHLETRLDVSYPECEECGSARSWGQESGGPMLCYRCNSSPSSEVRNEVHRQWERLLGGDGDGS